VGNLLERKIVKGKAEKDWPKSVGEPGQKNASIIKSKKSTQPGDGQAKSIGEILASAALILAAIEEVLTDGFTTDGDKQKVKHLIPHPAYFGRNGVKDNGMSGHGRQFVVDEAIIAYALYYQKVEKCALENADRQRFKERILGKLDEKGKL
jgi:hypothetical protein